MRVQYNICYLPKNITGKTGTILSHSNNTLTIRMDDSGKECKDLYWNWKPLDEEAVAYIAEVKRTAIPMTTPLCCES